MNYLNKRTELVVMYAAGRNCTLDLAASRIDEWLRQEAECPADSTMASPDSPLWESNWVNGWRPIETAPKDGTMILIGKRYKMGDRHVTAGCGHDCGWYGEDAEPIGFTPTHWMPIPELPDEE